MNCCKIGSYKCEVQLEDFYVDRCIAQEIALLRRDGIVTKASCCGHGVYRPDVAIEKEDVHKMQSKGYNYL